jgi:hypothetical protein
MQHRARSVPDHRMPLLIAGVVVGLSTISSRPSLLTSNRSRANPSHLVRCRYRSMSRRHNTLSRSFSGSGVKLEHVRSGNRQR